MGEETFVVVESCVVIVTRFWFLFLDCLKHVLATCVRFSVYEDVVLESCVGVFVLLPGVSVLEKCSC